MTEKIRCAWAARVPEIYTQYHDSEWGVPVFDDRILFEFLILEGFQAGLSWLTILKKRENFRLAFDQFDPEKISRFDQHRIAQLLDNPGIIRNRQKINAAVSNARAYLKIQSEFRSFSDYIWRFVEGRPIVNHWKTDREIPARTGLSDTISRDLYKRGFKFVGSTIIYAHMQATGMVNDHLVTCFRYLEVNSSMIRLI
jgi:DNA-3-methyladenine glycosylase I